MLYQTVLCLLTSSLFKNTVYLFPWVFFRNRSQTTLKCGREAKKKKNNNNDTWDVSRVCHWCSYHILKSAGNLNSYFTGHKRLVLYSFWPLQVNGHHGTSCFVPCIFKRPATFLFRLSTLRLRYNWIASFTQFFFFHPPFQNPGSAPVTKIPLMAHSFSIYGTNAEAGTNNLESEIDDSN